MQKKQNKKQNTEDGVSFLSRWSRRKSSADSSPESNQAVFADELESNVRVGQDQTDVQENQVVTVDESTGSGSITTHDEQPLTDKDMPDINNLTEKSDYSLFMSEGVSEELRKLALRKLFSGAGFNIKDGLDDYDDDFTSFEGLGGLVTCDMKHQQEMKEKRELEEQQEKQTDDQSGDGENIEDTENTTEKSEAAHSDTPDDTKTDLSEYEGKNTDEQMVDQQSTDETATARRDNKTISNINPDPRIKI